MHLKRKFVKMSFEEKNMKEMGKWTEDILLLKMDPMGWSAPTLGQYK